MPLAGTDVLCVREYTDDLSGRNRAAASPLEIHVVRASAGRSIKGYQMQKAIVGKWVQRGGLFALVMTGLVTAGCGGGGGGSGSSGTSTSGSGATSNSAPTISATPATQASVGGTYSLTPQASDADGDTLAFTIQNKPSWAEFNTATGALTGTPTAETTTSNIVITVSDGKTTASLAAFSITVGSGSVADSGSDSGSGSSPAQSVSGPNVALSWNVPTQTVDGQTLQTLSGYRIHYGTNQDAMVNAIEVPSAGSNSYTVGNLTTGTTYYFAVRAITSDGDESEISNVIARVIS